MSIQTVKLDELDWSGVPDSWAGKVAAGQPDVRFKPFTTGSPVVPRGQLVHYEAGHVEAPHSHVEGEIFYVIGGSFTIGEIELPARTLVYIAGGTEYGPSVAGPDGAEFLRFHLAGE